MADVQGFRDRIVNSGYVMDPEGVHSEFVSGMHGQKLDFDKIDDKTDPLYHEWIDVIEDDIRTNYDPLPEIILGVANGTNRVSVDVAKRFGGDVLGLVSAKDEKDSKKLWLPKYAAHVISLHNPELVVVLEDVGTTGSNSVQVAKSALEFGAQAVEVVTTWQRRERLERLEEAGIPYRAIINEPLPTYSAEECETLPQGFHARGWKFNPLSK